MPSSPSANLLALVAIALWALLAWLGISLSHVPLLIALGLGPLGAAFYVWDAALKKRRCAADWHLELHHAAGLHSAATYRDGSAAALIVGAAVMGMRAK